MRKRRLVTTRVVGMAMLLMATTSWSMLAADGSSPKADTANPPAAGKAANSAEKSSDQIAALKQQMALQQQQIEQMQKMMEQQKALLEKLSRESGEQAQQAAQQTTAPNLGQVASAVPMLPASPKPAASPVPNPAVAPVSQEQVKGYTEKVDNLQKSVDALNKGIGGFKVSGSVRLRSDNTIRSSNSVAGPQQNIRGRYRVLVDVDKQLGKQVDTHVEFGSGAFNNALTLDSDFTGGNTRGAVFISEAWGDYHPAKYISLRGGKMTEVFADKEQFLYDDDIRFNGGQEILKSNTYTHGGLGKVWVEGRFGQYVVYGPNVQILPSAAQCASATPPANCAFVNAGFPAGGKVRATDMFDQGIVIASKSERWGHQFTFNEQSWRNPNTMQLGSTAAGFPLVVNGYYGVGLSGALSGAGNGVRTSGGAIYTASGFNIGKVSYRVDYTGLKSSRQAWPVYLIAQGLDNFSGNFYNYAFQGAVGIGETKKAGDISLKYAFYYKEANSMISQITDDDVGTGTGVNIRTHALRFDVGLNKYMTWQNRIYIQNILAGNDPARNFFVPVQRGTGTQYRWQSQLQFTF